MKLNFLNYLNCKKEFWLELKIYIEEILLKICLKIIFPDKDNKEINNKTEEMLKYYTHEQEKEYGVIGIEIEIIVSNFRYTYNKLVRDKIPENIDNMKGKKQI